MTKVGVFINQLRAIDFSQPKNGLKRKKKKKKNRMPHWIFQKVLMRNKFLIWNGLMLIVHFRIPTLLYCTFMLIMFAMIENIS